MTKVTSLSRQLINYIKSKGIEVGENDSYTGELDDFMEALDVVESIVMRLEAERRENKKTAYPSIPRVYLTSARYMMQSQHARMTRACWIKK